MPAVSVTKWKSGTIPVVATLVEIEVGPASRVPVGPYSEKMIVPDAVERILARTNVVTPATPVSTAVAVGLPAPLFVSNQ